MLMNEYYSDYNTEPSATKWDKVRELGLHEMLKDFVYLNFRKTSIYSTSVGNKVNDAETSTTADNRQLRQQLETYGNDGAEKYNSIVEWMLEDKTNFPDYTNELLEYKTL